MQKKVLILNGTISEIPIIKTAKDMGFYVITSGNMPNLPGHKFSDEYICADYSNGETILKLVKEKNIGGIISCANDFGSITASYVGEKMNWRGHDTYENALLIHQKNKFMKYFAQKNFPVTWFEIFNDIDAAKDFCRNCKDYPVIVKATDLTGGKGILRVENFNDAAAAIDNAFKISRNKIVLIEPFLDGVQQSIVAFLVNRKVKIVSSSDIFCWRNPYLVQAETYPATNFDAVKNILCNIMETMAVDLNLCDGILSFQYIVKNGVPYVIDMMRRSFGNETLLLADERTGFNWEQAYIMASLGMSCENLTCSAPTSKFCGHYGIMARRNGVFKSFTIPAYLQKKIFKTTVNFKPGDIVENYLTDRMAHIYYRYEDFDEMLNDIKRCDTDIKVEVEA